jgi:hypothetical protein
MIGLSSVDTFDGFHDPATLLLHRRDVTPHPTKLCCSKARAKASADLLLDLQHPHISLSLVIMERDFEVSHKEQNFISLGNYSGFQPDAT